MEYYIQSDKAELFHIKILKSGAISLSAILDKLNLLEFRFIDRQQFYLPDQQTTLVRCEKGKEVVAEITHQKYYDKAT